MSTHMKKGFLKGLKKGALHSDLGIPQGQKIPAEAEEPDANDSPLLAKRKNFARVAKGWSHS